MTVEQLLKLLGENYVEVREYHKPSEWDGSLYSVAMRNVVATSANMIIRNDLQRFFLDKECVKIGFYLNTFVIVCQSNVPHKDTVTAQDILDLMANKDIIRIPYKDPYGIERTFKSTICIAENTSWMEPSLNCTCKSINFDGPNESVFIGIDLEEIDKYVPPLNDNKKFFYFPSFHGNNLIIRANNKVQAIYIVCNEFNEPYDEVKRAAIHEVHFKDGMIAKFFI